MKYNPYDKIYEKKCDVCSKTLLASKTGNGECPHCNWYNNSLGEINEDKVIFPNLISLNKAKLLFKEGKKLIPSLEDFLEAFEFYGETGFEYKNLMFCLYRYGDNGIEMGWGPKDDEVAYFKNKEDFIKNAKIGDEYIRDIWDKVKNPSYL